MKKFNEKSEKYKYKNKNAKQKLQASIDETTYCILEVENL